MSGIQKAERVELDIELDTSASGKLIESIVVRGDISGLSPHDKAVYYVTRCKQLGLDPASKPFTLLRLNGKEILYADKGCADQLAKIHRVNRKILAPPKIIDIMGKKEVYVECEASLPNGRSEYEVATVPLADPDNVFMKAVTKVKRRATLSILGLGMLDELEIETIPAHVKQDVPQIDLASASAIDMRAVHHAVATMAREDGTERFVVPAVALDTSGFGEDPGALDAAPLAEGVYVALEALEELGWRDDGQSVPVSLDQAAAIWLDVKRHVTADTAKPVWDLLMRASNAPSTRQLKLAVARATPTPDGTDRPRGGKPAANDGDAARDAAEAHRAVAAEHAGPAPAARATPSEVRALRVAEEALRLCHGPEHVARHYAAHVDALPAAVRGEYRDRALMFLAGRYPKAVGSRPAAEAKLDAAVQHRGQEVAA